VMEALISVPPVPDLSNILLSRKWGVAGVQTRGVLRVLKDVLRLRSRWRSMVTRLYSDNVYIHYTRLRGPLEANLRVQLLT
jgi:hypothetical protein